MCNNDSQRARIAVKQEMALQAAQGLPQRGGAERMHYDSSHRYENRRPAPMDVPGLMSIASDKKATRRFVRSPRLSCHVPLWLTALLAVVALPLISLAQSPPRSSLLDRRSAQVTPQEVALQNKRCLNCHGQSHISELTPSERRVMVGLVPSDEGLVAPDEPSQGAGQNAQELPPIDEEPAVRPGLYLGPNTLDRGVHADLRCIDCHRKAATLPHAVHLPPADCTGACHAEPGIDVLRSIHAEMKVKGDKQAPTCATCHGSHEILPKSDMESLVFPLNVVKVCGDCHEQHSKNTPEGYAPSDHVAAYIDSAHGRAVTGSGLVVAATCADCHGHHEVHPAADSQSLVHRENVPRTCGQCHMGVDATYRTSVHGQKLEAGDERAPVCTDCHTAHEITRANTPDFKKGLVEECGDCHDNPDMTETGRATFYETYRQSYHGQVTKLGSNLAARCSDCHGSHNILPKADSLSRLHPTNLVSTCRGPGGDCHAGANRNFITFDPHADFKDRERYPVLYAVWMYFVIVMSAAFGFFGLHCILWFLRSAVERVKNGNGHKVDRRGPGIRRFTVLNRVNHVFVIITFFGLTLTGMPLLFADQLWAQRLATFFGGGVAAGLWHRFFAIMLIGNFTVHMIGLVRSARRHNNNMVRNWLLGPRTMLPRIKDISDCIGMFRWFVFGGKKPRFDRWTYWEKFDYWAEIFGTGIIGGSGLLLWFPTFFSNFVPGWMFNVAMIVHGYEALLAVGFIFTIHFFNAHLRMEKFPVDDVIFSGQLPEEEFIIERPEEHARLVANGTLDELRVPPPAPWVRPLAIVIGILAMLIGVGLVALIILAGLQVL
ncbi:MAG: hypothetical protein D8M59_13630 [Planctomycetes bacterium]|nr:hypothetical protein [Planctomycetota bacterium]